MALSRKQRLTIVGIIIGGTALGIAYFFWGRYITMPWLQERSNVIKAWADRHYLLAVFWYMLANFALVLACIPAVPVMALLAGYLFGAFYGSIYATISATLGATASYMLFKYAMFDIIQERYGKRLGYLRRRLEKYGGSYLLVMHFLTVIPYCLINMVAVLGNVSWHTFFWTTVVGSAPLFIIYSLAGRKLSEIASMRDVLTWQSMMLFGVLILLALLPMVVKKWQERS